MVKCILGEMTTLDKQFKYLDSIRINYNRDEITMWLFEYSCQMIERLGYEPERNGDQIPLLMQGKLEKMIEPCTALYWEDEYRNLEITALPFKHIPEIVNTDYEQYKNAKKET